MDFSVVIADNIIFRFPLDVVLSLRMPAVDAGEIVLVQYVTSVDSWKRGSCQSSKHHGHRS